MYILKKAGGKTDVKMEILKGEAVSGGVAEGSVCLYKEDILAAAPKYDIPAREVRPEIERLREGIDKTKSELKNIHARVSESLSATEAEIFYAHIIILEDFAFIKQMEDYISSNRVNAERAVVDTVEEYKKSFGDLPGDYIRERADDLHDIARRIISNLGAKHAGFACAGCGPENSVIAAERLTTSLVSNLGAAPPAGLVTEKGSTVSHGAILARSLGVPVLIKVQGLLPRLGCGTRVLIDADRHKIYIHPTEKTRERYRRAAGRKKPFRKLDNGLLRTSDGVNVKISVNASSIKDIKNGNSKGAVDIGLMRTEFLFTGRSTRPGVEEQAAVYSQMLEEIKGEAAFRLLDSGSDKNMPFLNLPRQENPDLGLRGVRLYRMEPRILEEQIEAFFRAKKDRPLKIIVPMVSAIGEFTEVRDTIRRITASLGEKEPGLGKNTRLGCMIEVPSAAHTISHFVRECDFLSVGTNDLIQYMVGADRTSDYLEELNDPLTPAMASILGMILKGTEGSDKEITVCGEMAGSPRSAELLVGLGYRSLSIDPASIEETAGRLRSASEEKMKAFAGSLLEAGGLRRS